MKKRDYIKKLKFLTENIFINFEKNFDELNNNLIELEKFRLELIKKIQPKKSFNYSLELKKLIKKLN